MAKIHYDTTKNFDVFLEIIELNNLSAEDVLRMFTNYHGLQLLTQDFLEDLRDCEGYSFPSEAYDDEEGEE